MSSQRPRQPRRSACNRCRTYKLRCERDPRQADGSCERCRKSGAACITTTTAAPAASAIGSPAPTRLGAQGASSDSRNATRPVGRLAPMPPRGCGSHDPSRPMRQIQPAGCPANVARPEEDASEDPHAGALEAESPVLVRSPSFDFNLSSFAPPDGGRDTRAGPDKPLNIGWQQHFTESSLGDVGVFGGSYMDLVPQDAADPLPHDLVLANTANPETPSPRHSVNSWHGSLATSSSLTKVAGTDDSYVCLAAPHHDREDDTAADLLPRTYLPDVLELSSRLAADNESLDTADVYPPYADNAPSPIELAVQRALDRSSHLCELLKGIGAGAPSSPAHTSSFKSRGMGPACCVVLTTSLVTAYILLVRSWRRIFVHLHRLLLDNKSMPPRRGGVQERAGGRLAFMPSLSLGGFRVQGSPAMQVSVLIELSFDMLGQVETALGAGCWGVGRARGGDTGVQQRQPVRVLEGPVAISIRDMLLTQEMARLGEDPDGLDSLPLGDLAGQLKEQLRD